MFEYKCIWAFPLSSGRARRPVPMYIGIICAGLIHGPVSTSVPNAG
ncbi:MAG TPA: hypothetical protein VK668_09465 [Mucilaginibacter sp.]|nr:hypothetical protein [Mucilaginibacter sp.]